LLSFPRGTEMFQFPRFPLPSLCVQLGVTGHDPCRVSPFGDPRIEAWSAAPRGLSQPPTSFIGIWRQGIHRWLFVAWNLQDARARYAVLKERSSPCPGAVVPQGTGGLASSGRPEGAGRRLTQRKNGARTGLDLVPSKRNSGFRHRLRSCSDPRENASGRFAMDEPISQ
jgi:hypothetical protein